MNKEQPQAQVPEENLEDVTGGGFSKDSKVMYYCPNPDCDWELEMDWIPYISDVSRRSMAQQQHDYGGRTCSKKGYLITQK